MRFEQTRDALLHVERFHRLAEQLYGELLEQAEPRVVMLLDYLRRHEAKQADNLRGVIGDLAPRVLNGWFKYSHDKDILLPLDTARRQPPKDFDEAFDVAFRLDEKLLEFYQEMIEQSPSAEAREIFINLLGREMKEKQKLMRGALGLLDL